METATAIKLTSAMIGIIESDELLNSDIHADPWAEEADKIAFCAFHNSVDINKGLMLIPSNSQEAMNIAKFIGGRMDIAEIQGDTNDMKALSALYNRVWAHA